MCELPWLFFCCFGLHMKAYSCLLLLFWPTHEGIQLSKKAAIAKKTRYIAFVGTVSILEPQEHVLQLDVQDGSWSLPRSAG